MFPKVILPYGHEESSFDYTAEKFLTEGRKVFSQGPKVTKNVFFSDEKHSNLICFCGHVENSYEKLCRSVFNRWPKFFSSVSEKDQTTEHVRKSISFKFFQREGRMNFWLPR